LLFTENTISIPTVLQETEVSLESVEMVMPTLMYTKLNGRSLCPGKPDTSAVLTWLFGWLNELRVQVWAVLCIYSALVLLPTSTYSVKTHPCGQRQALAYFLGSYL
jgi:hypothetical protein